MGSWYMNLSEYMGGRCLWKFNSMGGGVQKSTLFFSGIALTNKTGLDFKFQEKVHVQ